MILPAPAWGTEASDVLRLVNTHVDTGSSVEDFLPTADAMREWCRDRELDDPATARELAAVRALRSDAREALVHVIERKPLPPALRERINRAAAGSVQIGLDENAALTWRSDHRTAADLLARELVLLAASPLARTLRICAAPDCDRLFVQDHGRRAWCSAQCGNRTRARRHAARRASAAR